MITDDLPLIGVSNWLDETGVSLSGSEAGDMALTNMRVASIREKWWRSLSNTSITLEGSLAGLRDVNVVAFAQPPLGVMLTAADDIRLRLYDGASEVHDSGTVSVELSEDGYWVEVIPAGVSCDGFRLDFDLASNGYVQIGRLWLAEAEQLRTGPTYPLEEAWAGGGANLLAPASGVRVPREEPLRRVRGLSWEFLSGASAAAARRHDRTARGTRQVLYVEKPVSDPLGCIYFGVFGDGSQGAPPGQTMWEFSKDGFVYRRALTITEDL